MKEEKVYVLISWRGDLAYISEIESIHLTLKGAENAKKIFDETHMSCYDTFPMSEEQWESYNYGMDRKNHNNFTDRGGFTASQFKEMWDLMEKKGEQYEECEIKEFIISE